MALTDTAIRSAKPPEKIYKIADEKGLYLEIRPNGAKYWRLKYRVARKQKRISLGVYPTVSLKEARNSCDEKKKLLENGIDPSLERKARKHLRAERTANSFEAVAREWHAKRAPGLAESHVKKIIRRLEIYIFPWLGGRPISEITPPELLAVMRKVENQGILETAHRVLQTCSQVFRYAIVTGRAERDAAADLRGALPPAQGGLYCR